MHSIKTKQTRKHEKKAQTIFLEQTSKRTWFCLSGVKGSSKWLLWCCETKRKWVVFQFVAVLRKHNWKYESYFTNRKWIFLFELILLHTSFATFIFHCTEKSPVNVYGETIDMWKKCETFPFYDCFLAKLETFFL